MVIPATIGEVGIPCWCRARPQKQADLSFSSLFAFLLVPWKGLLLIELHPNILSSAFVSRQNEMCWLRDEVFLLHNPPPPPPPSTRACMSAGVLYDLRFNPVWKRTKQMPILHWSALLQTVRFCWGLVPFLAFFSPPFPTINPPLPPPPNTQHHLFHPQQSPPPPINTYSRTQPNSTVFGVPLSLFYLRLAAPPQTRIQVFLFWSQSHGSQTKTFGPHMLGAHGFSVGQCSCYP